MKEWSKSAYQIIASPFIKFCVNTGITANQITILNHFMTLTIGCYAFSQGTYLWGILGLMVCLLNGFLDYLDGDICRETNTSSSLGVWLDSGFDVIIQNAVMASIAVGCYKQGLPLWVVLIFMIANSAMNFVSFNYNQKFGFDSAKGNALFRSLMSQRINPLNTCLKNIIDPTSNYIALTLFTFRYFIALGVVLNIMPACFVVMTIISNIKWFVMYIIYALHLRGDNWLHVLKVLATLDEERSEYYALRNSQKV